MSTRKRRSKRIKKKTKRQGRIGKKLKKYDRLSPFELKNILIKGAKGSHPTKMLNAGRGNPNFFNIFVRKIFSHFQYVCAHISHPLEKIPGRQIFKDLHDYPPMNATNYKQLLLKKVSAAGIPPREKSFIQDYLNYLEKEAKKSNIPTNKIFHDVVMSHLGCFYPSPPRIQPHVSLVCKNFMFNLIFGGRPTREKPSNYEFFATEGAAAGILYIFNTLHINGLLNPGDKIALITPIFSPYLEMPVLERYRLKMIFLKGNPNKEFSLDDEEIDRLKDKSIKALFMVNPANPSAFSLPLRNIKRIGDIVNSSRKDLIILSDNVYAPFVDEYNSLAYSCPKNTIEVFSLSKYFGVTGWRLGITSIRKENNLNKLLRNLSLAKKKELRERYSIASTNPDHLTFMERLVMDSRQVAEAHVGGLSTPQQAILAMFLYYQMHDLGGHYKKEIQAVLLHRMQLLYSELNTRPEESARATNYYTLLFIPQITENLFGKAARRKMEMSNYLKFLFHLANKYHTVLLPGKGFEADPWRIRVSLANLATSDYKKISINLRKCIKDFIT
jgi:aspartate 4-decarboxylase